MTTRSRLPEHARHLPALLHTPTLDLPETVRDLIDEPHSNDLVTHLTMLAEGASRAASVCLSSTDPDLNAEAVALLLTLRAWLLAVAASVATAAPHAPAPCASEDGQWLRDRYAHDLRAARIDGVLHLIDDLLDV